MRLKQTIKSDLGEILKMEQDVSNVEFIIPYDLIEHQKVMNEKSEEHLSIFDENSRLVGFILLAELYSDNNSIEFKRIVVSDKGKGYGSKAIQLIQKKSFGEYNCNRLWLDVFEFNLKAIHVYEKLGFRKESIKSEYIKSHQGHKNLVIMSILRNEYQYSTGWPKSEHKHQKYI